MALKVGDKAPDFELTTKSPEGPKKIKLSGNSGKKNTVLLFFPMAFTGVCTTEMCDVSQGLKAYEDLNAQVYGIRSAGKDGSFSAAYTVGPTTAFNNDIVYSNGSFIAYPEGVQQ